MGKMKGLWQEYGMQSGRFSADYSKMEPYIMHSMIPKSSGMMTLRKSDGQTIRRPSITEQIEHELKETKERLASLEEAQLLIKQFETTYKRGDVVFSKDTGPAILKNFSIHRDYGMDRPADINGNPIDIKNNELIVILSSVDGESYVPAKNIVPYTESVRLLYEAERSRAD